MPAYVKSGHRGWKLTVDDEGYRTYDLQLLIMGANPLDGPATIYSAGILPSVGSSTWDIDNDADPWCFRTPYLRLTPAVDKEKNSIWLADLKYTNKPNKRCQTAQIDNPLLEPQKKSGSFVKFTKEVNRDRYGTLIKSSSHEMLRGPQVEFDDHRMNVRIEQNVLNLDLGLVGSMMNTVNGSTLWGLGPRKVKLGAVSFDEKWYGTCTAYWTRSFEFDIDYAGWDRYLLDEGTKALNGRWNEQGEYEVVNINGAHPNRNNPKHFTRYKDRNGENTRVILNGAGMPASSTIAVGTAAGTGTYNSSEPGIIEVEYYGESNFLLLGIPSSL